MPVDAEEGFEFMMSEVSNIVPAFRRIFMIININMIVDNFFCFLSTFLLQVLVFICSQRDIIFPFLYPSFTAVVMMFSSFHQFLFFRGESRSLCKTL
jgi:hypothetical protein